MTVICATSPGFGDTIWPKQTIYPGYVTLWGLCRVFMERLHHSLKVDLAYMHASHVERCHTLKNYWVLYPNFSNAWVAWKRGFNTFSGGTDINLMYWMYCFVATHTEFLIPCLRLPGMVVYLLLHFIDLERVRWGYRVPCIWVPLICQMCLHYMISQRVGQMRYFLSILCQRACIYSLQLVEHPHNHWP